MEDGPGIGGGKQGGGLCSHHGGVVQEYNLKLKRKNRQRTGFGERKSTKKQPRRITERGGKKRGGALKRTGEITEQGRLTGSKYETGNICKKGGASFKQVT